MSDNDPSTWFSFKETLIAALGFIVTMGGVFGGIEWRRFIAVEKKAHNSISREEHRAAMQALETKIDDGFKSTHERQDALILQLLGPSVPAHARRQHRDTE